MITIPQGAGSGLNFSPANFTLIVGVNNTVTFVDQDTIAPHNVYFTSVPSGASQPPTSPTLTKGDSFTVTLTTPGTYTYECQFHAAWMKGTIMVVSGSSGGSSGAGSGTASSSSSAG